MSVAAVAAGPVPARPITSKQSLASTKQAQSPLAVLHCHARHPSVRLSHRQQVQGGRVVCGMGQRSNSTTRKRLNGPPGLPPVNNNEGGGGGGGGWFGPNTMRSILLNGALISFIFMLDHYSHGGGGGGGGFFGGGGGGGYGPQEPEVRTKELPLDDGDDDSRRGRGSHSGAWSRYA